MPERRFLVTGGPRDLSKADTLVQMEAMCNQYPCTGNPEVYSSGATPWSLAPVFRNQRRFKLNDCGEALVGSTAGLRRSGRLVSLEQLAAEITDNERVPDGNGGEVLKYRIDSLTDINDGGALLSYISSPVAAPGGTFLLVPMGVDLVSRDSGTGEYSTLGGEIAESTAVPEVDLRILESSIDGTNLIVSVAVDNHDPLSELPGVQALDQLDFLVNGDVIETIGNLSGQSEGEPVPVWQARSARATVERTFVLPLAAGVQTIQAKTGLNEAGNYGFDSAAVIVGKHPADQVAIDGNLLPSLRAAATLSASVLDTLHVQFPGQAEAALAESAPQSNYFTGSAPVNGTLVPLALRIKAPDAFSPTAVDAFGAVVDPGGATPLVLEGWWRETAAASGQFSCVEMFHSGESPGLYFVDRIVESGIAPAGHVQPFVARFTFPEGMIDRLAPGGPLQLTLNGEEIELVASPGLVPDAGFAASQLYVKGDTGPRVFMLADGFEGTSLTPDGAIADGEFSFELRDRADETLLWSQGFTVNLAPAALPVMAGQQGAGPLQAAGASLEPEDFEAQMYNFYAILFQDYGQRLLVAAGSAGVDIVFDSIWFDFDNWDLENYTDGAGDDGKQPKIRLDRDDLKTPVRAANGQRFTKEGLPIEGGNAYEILEESIANAGRGKKTRGEVVQHDLPLQTGGRTGELRNLQLEFLKRGLDPNDGALSGRVLPTEFHKEVIHGRPTGRGLPPGGAWAYQWTQFFNGSTRPVSQIDGDAIL